MKNKTIFLIFGTIFLIFAGVIWQNTHKITNDVFTLAKINLQDNEKAVINGIIDNLKKNLVVISKDINVINEIVILAEKSKIFKSINYKADDFDIKKLKNLSLVLLDENNTHLALEDKNTFFLKSLQKLFSSTSFLSLNDDFFSLIKPLSQSYVDINSAYFKKSEFYIINFELFDKFDDKSLINFAKEVKKFKDTFITSSALYSAYAKQTALKESTFFSIISITVILLFLYSGFGNFKVLWIFAIILFSLTCAFGVAFLVLDHIHGLCLVVSTSLAGLIVDYSMHFLSANMDKKIKPSDVKSMLKVFLAGLFITALGYALFLFSDMKFLHEIAVISVVSLTASFFASYFLLPNLLSGTCFKHKAGFKRAFDFYMKICLIFLQKKIMTVLCVLVSGVLILGGYKALNTDFRDNIKNYSSISKNLSLDTVFISKILKTEFNTKFIIVDENRTKSLYDELNDKSLIKNGYFVSFMFNNINTQNALKKVFLKAAKDDEILNLYLKSGFEKEDILPKFYEIANLKTFSKQQSCYELMQSACNKFFIDGKEVIFVSDVYKNDEFNKILSKYGAFYSDYISKLNEGFTDIKINALYLKLSGFILALFVLCGFFGFKKAVIVLLPVIFCSILSVCVFVILNHNIDIFAIFGFILASAVGVDYMLFSQNSSLKQKDRIFGIIMAAMTSIVSFAVLTLSSTNAVFSFGLSVSLTLALNAFAASLLSFFSKLFPQVR